MCYFSSIHTKHFIIDCETFPINYIVYPFAAAAEASAAMVGTLKQQQQQRSVRHISVSCYFLILLTHHLQNDFPTLSINSFAPCTKQAAQPSSRDSNLYTCVPFTVFDLRFSDFLLFCSIFCCCGLLDRSFLIFRHI